MRFIEDQGSSFSKTTQLEDESVGNRGNTFIWSIGIVILLGLNIGSWAFCNMVFGHPEHSFSYGLLTKLEKITPLKGFKTTTVPSGKFMNAKDFYARVYPFSNSQLRAYNGMLLRNYLWNYSEKDPAYFIHGSFTIEKVRALTDADMFPQGIVVTATAYKFPDGKVELVLPTVDTVDIADHFKVGEKLEIGRSTMAATVLHAHRNGEEPMVFVAVPLITKDAGNNNLAMKTPSGKTLLLQTPETVNIR